MLGYQSLDTRANSEYNGVLTVVVNMWQLEPTVNAIIYLSNRRCSKHWLLEPIVNAIIYLSDGRGSKHLAIRANSEHNDVLT